MSHIHRFLLTISLLSLIGLAACTGPTATPEPTATPTPEPTATPTTASSGEPTPTPLTAEQEQILETWKVLAFVQLEAKLLKEIGMRVEDGSIEGDDVFSTLIALGALVEGVESSLPEIEPLPTLQSQWDAALETHAQTQDIVARWFDREIEAEQALTEIEPALTDAEALLEEAEAVLAESYDIAPEDMEATREGMYQQVSGVIFAALTPTPEE